MIPSTCSARVKGSYQLATLSRRQGSYQVAGPRFKRRKRAASCSVAKLQARNRTSTQPWWRILVTEEAAEMPTYASVVTAHPLSSLPECEAITTATAGSAMPTWPKAPFIHTSRLIWARTSEARHPALLRSNSPSSGSTKAWICSRLAQAAVVAILAQIGMLCRTHGQQKVAGWPS